MNICERTGLGLTFPGYLQLIKCFERNSSARRRTPRSIPACDTSYSASIAAQTSASVLPLVISCQMRAPTGSSPLAFSVSIAGSLLPAPVPCWANRHSGQMPGGSASGTPYHCRTTPSSHCSIGALQASLLLYLSGCAQAASGNNADRYRLAHG